MNDTDYFSLAKYILGGPDMSCRICHRSSCTESFHSLEEQNMYEEDEHGNLNLKEEHREDGSDD